MSSLAAILESQSSLIREASLALPHHFDKCTHGLGPIRQAVHLCLTCNVPRGLCSACSIACHGDHEQLELFPKRNFTCDCPTSAFSQPCTLRPASRQGGAFPANASNVYGQNFEGGVFCRCHRKYNPRREQETMVQCLVCEDWFHESCLNLRERIPSRSPSPESPTEVPDETPVPSPSPPHTQGDVTSGNTDPDEEASDVPLSLISPSQYETLICGWCVSRNSVLKKYAGTPGVQMVMRVDQSSPWKIVGTGGGEDEDVSIVDQSGDQDVGAVGEKRRRSSSPERASKKARLESGSSGPPSHISPCLAPRNVPSLVKEVMESISSASQPSNEKGHGDIFLTEGWRDRWCKCQSCLPALTAQPYLLQEEETYEPPEDEESSMSLEELGMRALQRLPRDRAIDGIRAYNEMRDELMLYLRPFALEGKEVTERDITAFFEAKRAEKKDT